MTLSSHCTAMAGYLFCRVLTSTPRQARPGRPDTVGRDRRHSVGSTMTLTYSRRMLAASDARISQTADNLPIFERTAIPLYFTCHCRRWFGNLEFSPSSLVWPPYRGTGTADQADLVKLGSAQLNLMSLHSTLVWQLPIIEHKIHRHGGRSWKRHRPSDKPHDDDDDVVSPEIFRHHIYLPQAFQLT